MQGNSSKQAHPSEEGAPHVGVDELQDTLQPGVPPVGSFPGDKDLQYATPNLIASLVQPGATGARRCQLSSASTAKASHPATHLRSNSVTLLTLDWLYCTNSLNRKAKAERDTCAPGKRGVVSVRCAHTGRHSHTPLFVLFSMACPAGSAPAACERTWT